MNKKLKISVGKYSSAEIKAQIQDFHGVFIFLLYTSNVAKDLRGGDLAGRVFATKHKS